MVEVVGRPAACVAFWEGCVVMSGTSPQVDAWMDRIVIDSAGAKVGTVSDVYVDDETSQPDWLAVKTGMFGTKVSFVPIQGARLDGETVAVAFEKEKIKDAPRIETDGALSVDDERELYAYYGRGYEAHSGRGPLPVPTMDTAAPVRDARRETDASMVRSEEELTVNKRTQETGRVKLRKWVETENVQVTVPVEKQMARVVREPVRDGDTSGVGAFVDGEEEIVLSEEVVDVSKRVVAKERVGLATETVTEEVPVNETVRKERVAVEGDKVVGDGKENR